jgi:hypothetical protein
VSTGAIVVVSVVGLLTAVFIPLRIDVARQRRAIETIRARLAAATVRRSAKGVPVQVTLKIGKRDVRVTRSSMVALADDGLYCLSEDGRWGGRIRFAPGPPEIGDVVLAREPSLVMSGRLVEAGEPLPPETAALAAVPADGLLVRLVGDIGWFVAVPEADAWHVALLQALRSRR